MDLSKLPIQPTPNLGIFILLAGIAALAAIGVVAFNNAVRSALCLVVNFFVLAFMYFTLNAEMLGITQIVVYTGAIMVLFLFVIMLLNLGAPQALEEKSDLKKPIGILLGICLFGLISSQLIPAMINITAIKTDTPTLNGFGSPQAVGRGLMTGYLYPFEIASVLLMIGIVGSILLAKRKVL